MVAGKKVLFGFAAAMGAVAMVGLVAVQIILSMPRVEKDQRTMSTQLTFAYQKYRFDNKAWPVSAADAAEGFRSENATLFDRVEKAEKEWGLKTRIVNPESNEPMLEIVYEKPSHFERRHALYKQGSARRSRTSANY